MNAPAARLLSAARDLALDAVFPPRCAGCRTWSDELFCPACRATLRPIVAPFCARCGIPLDACEPSERPAEARDALCAECRPDRRGAAPPFRALRSVYSFEGALRQAVHRFKYADKIALAAPLAAILGDFLREQSTQIAQSAPIPPDQLALLTPVPLHPWRRYRRGYNQSELLARELSQQIGVPSGVVLRRVRHTAPQVELRARARRENVRDAFAVDTAALAASQKSSPRDGAVLLIDDVCTTGATLRECARVLREAGADTVYALTLARQL